MSAKKRMTLCTKCGGGHYDKAGNGKCSRCRSNDKQKELVERRCPTCGKAMRTALKNMTECKECLGEANYHRLLRASKK
jgi:predicted amidophosphoribosyltransferase